MIIYTYHPHSLLHCPQYLLVAFLLFFLLLLLLFFLFICCFSNCFPLLQVLLHNALGAGLFCSTCGLLPTFSLAIASPLLVKKKCLILPPRTSNWLASHPQTPLLNVIMTLTVGKMICESPLTRLKEYRKMKKGITQEKQVKAYFFAALFT